MRLIPSFTRPPGVVGTGGLEEADERCGEKTGRLVIPNPVDGFGIMHSEVRLATGGHVQMETLDICGAERGHEFLQRNVQTYNGNIYIEGEHRIGREWTGQ